MYKLEEIEVEELDYSDSIWVYDIEVPDNHMFFGNDILLHNSNYYYFGKLVEERLAGEIEDLPAEDVTEELKKIIREELTPLIDRTIKRAGDHFNLKNNILSMKQEAIARTGLFYSKKMYALSLMEMEGVRFSEDKLKITGLTAIRLESSSRVREYLKDLIFLITTKKYSDFTERFLEIEEEFFRLPAKDISFIKTANFITEKNHWSDPNQSKIPAQIKAAIYYNRFQQSGRLPAKYPPILNGEKIQFIYLKKEEANLLNIEGNNFDVIAWPNIDLARDLIEELGWEDRIDYKKMFEKNIISKIKSYVPIRTTNKKEFIRSVPIERWRDILINYYFSEANRRKDLELYKIVRILSRTDSLKLLEKYIPEELPWQIPYTTEDISIKKIERLYKTISRIVEVKQKSSINQLTLF